MTLQCISIIKRDRRKPFDFREPRRRLVFHIIIPTFIILFIVRIIPHEYIV